MTHNGEQSTSQPESDSLVSEEDDEEDEEEVSEEELLALRREGWVWISDAGFSAARKQMHAVKFDVD